MKINTTLRIDGNAIEYYKDNYKSNHAGCVLAVESFPYLRDEATKLLDGIFTPNELKFMADASNGSKINPKEMTSRRHWEAEIGDYYESHQSNVQLSPLIVKIRELSPMERLVLRESIIISR